MNLKWRKIYSWVILMVILAIVLPACGAGNTSPTLTPIGIEAIYTSAAQTLVAQLTGTAAALPPATPTLTATATGTTTPTLAAVATQTQAAGTVPTSGNSGAVGCNNSLFITDVTIPDKQVVAPGQAFTKTWRVQNTGSCAWNSNYKLTFLSGDVMSGAATAISQTVNVSATADISVSLIAPIQPQDLHRLLEAGNRYRPGFRHIHVCANLGFGRVRHTRHARHRHCHRPSVGHPHLWPCGLLQFSIRLGNHPGWNEDKSGGGFYQDLGGKEHRHLRVDSRLQAGLHN